MKSIEKRSEVIPRQQYDSTISVDHRYYKNNCNQQRRVRISIYRKNSLAVELLPDDAIKFFKEGIAYAEALKATAC